jgi:methionyl-tRNA formyltransferase
MKKILFCGYRPWAKKIYDKLLKEHGKECSFNLVETPEGLEKQLQEQDPSAILFIGWSWIVRKEVVDKHLCICLHPSPLPKYRGGSPLQHQIINGEKQSAVTLFRMNEYIDKGEIYFQEEFSLSGDLKDVFDRMVEVGTGGVLNIADKIINSIDLNGVPQNHEEATYFKRRVPKMSEIKIEDFLNFTAEEVYNKIRALQDPYPNAFIVCRDGSKLFLHGASIEEKNE